MDCKNINKEINIKLALTLLIKPQKRLFSINNGHFFSNFFSVFIPSDGTLSTYATI